MYVCAQTFLETRLEVLEHQQRKAQCTMLATWLLELHLDRLNRRLLDESDGAHVVVGRWGGLVLV